MVSTLYYCNNRYWIMTYKPRTPRSHGFWNEISVGVVKVKRKHSLKNIYIYIYICLAIQILSRYLLCILLLYIKTFLRSKLLKYNNQLSWIKQSHWCTCGFACAITCCIMFLCTGWQQTSRAPQSSSFILPVEVQVEVIWDIHVLN